ncbi:hypothetical protein [Psychrobacillus phage Perkons]|nr:hypothetical protein [Psychrobacillus phage Perkons]
MDTLQIDNMIVKANYSSWEVAKEYLHKEYPFNTPLYILTEDLPTALTLEDMERLRDYLNDRIKYLES